MKQLSLVLGKSRFRSIILPGVVAAIGLHPLLAPLSRAGGLPLSDPILIVIEIAFFGLLLSSASRWIFFFLEGYRFPRILVWNKHWLEKRVAKRTAELKQLRQKKGKLSDEEVRRASLLTYWLLRFPLDPPRTDELISARVASPTMLGNIVASYEEYPSERYNIDGEHFWFHFLYLAPQSALSDFQELDDTASSLALSAVAAFVVAISYIVFLAGRGVGCLIPKLALVTAQVPNVTAMVILGLAVLGVGLFYIMSLSAFRDVGRAFQALVDITLSEFLDFLETADFEPRQDIAERAKVLKRFQRFNIRDK